MFGCCNNDIKDLDISENMKRKQNLSKQLTHKTKNPKKYNAQYNLKPFEFNSDLNVKMQNEFNKFKEPANQKYLEYYYHNLQNISSYYPIDKFPIYNFGDYIYQGNIEGGVKNRYGRIFYLESEEYYEGEWSNNKYNGKGIKINKEGCIFGTFIDNEVNGHDIIFHKSNGITYQGTIADGKETGKAHIKYNSKCYYIGIVKDGLREGYGVFVEDDKVYTGNFKKDLLKDKNGRLKIKNKDQNKCIEIEGNFKKGKLNGLAKIKFGSGDIFEGEFKDHKKNGYGYLTTKNDIVYGGSWKEDELNGEGTYTKDGFTVDIEFENGKIIKVI